MHDEPWLEPEDAERPSRRAVRPPRHGEQPSVEGLAVARAHRRALLDAAAALPGRCPRLVRALLAEDPGPYPRLAARIGVPRGSLGPLRARCLDCLRRRLDPDGWPRRARR